MPPRYAYWTILIDNKPTAFRARERDELLPTLHQLRRKNADVMMKWFARGRLWESPEAERAAERAPKPPSEKRGRDWRPGGQHRDPRDRFKKGAKQRRERSDVALRFRPAPKKTDVAQVFRPAKSWHNKDRPSVERQAKSWRDRPPGQNRKPPGPGDHRQQPRGRDEEMPPERREAEPPSKRGQGSPDRPPSPEQIAIKPVPPERGRPSDE